MDWDDILILILAQSSWYNLWILVTASSQIRLCKRVYCKFSIYIYFSVFCADLDCSDRFSQHTSTHSRGGVQRPGATSISACLRACRQMDDCLAVDYDHAQQACYIHVEGYLDDVRFDIKVVDQYRRGTCRASSTMSTISTLSTSGISSDTPPGLCSNSIKYFVSWHHLYSNYNNLLGL